MLEAPDLVTKLGSGCISSEPTINLRVQLACVLTRPREPAFLEAVLNEGIQYGDLVFRAPNPGRPLVVLRGATLNGAVAALGAEIGGRRSIAAGHVHRARADGHDAGGLDGGG